MEDGKIFMKKRCSQHGEETVLESSSEDFYHILPTPKQCRSQQSIEPLGPTCVGLIEITDRCNLDCPLCFAESGPSGSYLMSLGEFKDRVQRLIERKGRLDILMLSGGEPTVHPQLAEMLEWAYNSPLIGHILLNTNGILIAEDKKLQQTLLGVFERLELYLQFDSLSSSTISALRGASAILEHKQRALSWLQDHGFAVTFASVVTLSTTTEQIAELIELALSTATVRGITFQPAFASGRHKLLFDPLKRVTTPDVVQLISEACPDKFSKEAFTNLPCSHPNCATVAYFLKAKNKLWPLCEDIVPTESLRRRVNYDLEDLQACGCETTQLGRYITNTELSHDNSFRIVIKPFMDRYNLNRDRTEQCCTHVVGPEGELRSFCEYNVFRDEINWNVDSQQSSEKALQTHNETAAVCKA
jgi:uncharacterized radical SAM superfamily Fe-S cluster-containing enzyme